jgi:subtilisin family serine protease
MSTYPQQLNPRPGVTLILDPTRLVLAFKERPARELAVSSTVSELGLVPEGGETARAADTSQRQVINNTEFRYWVRSSAATALPEDMVERVQESFRDNLDWVGPVYRMENEEGLRAFVCLLPNVLLVKPTPTASQTGGNLAALLSRYGLSEVTEKSRYLGEYRYFVLDDPLAASSFDIRNQLLDAEPQLVQELRFESMPMVVPTASIPNDPLFAQQWDMTQIQAGGAGSTGWDISTGKNTVVICVLDEGCDLTHPDLQFSTPGINLGTMMPDGSPTGDHGTACAGIAAARYNNAEGIAGVAGNCRIMPLAFSTWSDTEVAAGINYATANGADVISMSFGWNAWDPAIIDPAIQNAYGNGLVMCVATHNYNGSITYPATNPLVIACGASDEVDNRKTPDSPDGEEWGSNYGPQISVVAPGVHIPTTDRQGSHGYNTDSGAAGNYYLAFHGTSAATPHVASLVALLLSVNPGLTNVQVRNIIEGTADKVGVVPYAKTPGYPNGTWNQEMGYGRINVLRALNRATQVSLRFPDLIRYLAWAWIIIIGGLMITPGGVLCIVCGVPIDAVGFIGYPAITFLGIGSIVLGVVGLTTSILEVTKGKSLN